MDDDYSSHSGHDTTSQDYDHKSRTYFSLRSAVLEPTKRPTSNAVITRLASTKTRGVDVIVGLLWSIGYVMTKLQVSVYVKSYNYTTVRRISC